MAAGRASRRRAASGTDGGDALPSGAYVPLDSPEGVARQAEELTRRLLDRREYPRPPGAYSEWWLALLAGYVAADEQWADQVVLDVITRLHAAVMAEAGPLLRAARDR